MSKKKQTLIVNDFIRADMVRIIGKNIEAKVVTLSEAKRIAKERGEDLILTVPNAKPPVCKVMDLGKHLYEEKKKKKDQEKKQRENRVEIKEMRFRPHIDDHDFNFKKNHIIKFLKDNNKVKCNVMFRGREFNNTDDGKIVLLRMADEVSEFGIVESMPRMEGRRMFMTLKPKK